MNMATITTMNSAMETLDTDDQGHDSVTQIFIELFFYF